MKNQFYTDTKEYLYCIQILSYYIICLIWFYNPLSSPKNLSGNHTLLVSVSLYFSFFDQTINYLKTVNFCYGNNVKYTVITHWSILKHSN